VKGSDWKLQTGNWKLLDMNILAIGAHAADMEFTCGAALALAVQEGGQATLLHMTLGEKGHPKLSAEAYAVQKRREAEQAAQRLGAAMRALDYKDAELPYNDDVALRVCDIIREVRPETVITHWGGSGHKDHQNTHYIVNDAVFFAALPSIRRASGAAHSVRQLYYAENWEDALHYDPDTYIDITPIYETWVNAASAYELFRGGISSFRYADYYKALSITRGALAGFAHAEAMKAAWGKQKNYSSWAAARGTGNRVI
jgi:LmbE family N-acetylglucosaminyl deacetylase